MELNWNLRRTIKSNEKPHASKNGSEESQRTAVLRILLQQPFNFKSRFRWTEILFPELQRVLFQEQHSSPTWINHVVLNVTTTASSLKHILSLQVLVTHWTSHSIIHKLFIMKVQPLCCWTENTILSHEQLAVYRADVTTEIDHQQFRLKLWDQNKRLVRRNEAGLHLTQNTTANARVQAVSTTPVYVCVGAWHYVLTRWDVMFLSIFKRTKSQPIRCFMFNIQLCEMGF